MDRTTIRNPIMWADVPDVDVIRMADTFYMVSTSMHTFPGCPIMKSKDLAHWEVITYIFDRLEDNDAHNLIDGKDIYGKGSWAVSLRYHKDTFYACFSSNDMQRFYIYYTKDIESRNWERYVIEGLYHDPALLFDNDRAFVIYGCGDIRIRELTEEVSSLKEGGVDQILLTTDTEGIGLRCEGGHAYLINGVYYLLYIEWPTTGHKRRRVICYRSEQLLGRYERKVLLDDDCGYHNKGVAQGAIFDSESGDWYSMLFQDHDAVGRIPYILPVVWKEGWPVFGVNDKIPEYFEVPFAQGINSEITCADEFNYEDEQLGLNWQWNHNPESMLWSVTKRPGFLRLTAGNIADDILHARNTLTQRTVGPFCTAVIKMDAEHLKKGDCAGIVALQSKYGTVGIRRKKDGKNYLVMSVKGAEGQDVELERILFSANEAYLKITFDFNDSRDIATFYYSTDEEHWTKIGCDLAMKYTLDHFMGYRIGLFQYATLETGGYAEFDYFHFSI